VEKGENRKRKEKKGRKKEEKGMIAWGKKGGKKWEVFKMIGTIYIPGSDQTELGGDGWWLMMITDV